MRTSTREYGVLVPQLDNERLLELGKRVAREAYPGEDLAALQVAHQPQMLVTIPGPGLAKTAVVNREGVGHIEKDRTVAVYFTHHYTTFALDLPLEEVQACWDCTTIIDLADGIRTFGARLEVNFYRWHCKATGTC